MTKIDLDELERKAKAALQSTWSPDDPSDPQDVLDDERGKLVVRCYRAPIAANTLHIAAASPPVVLALIARIRELEGGLRDAIACHESIRERPLGRSAPWHALLEKGAVLP